MNKRILLGLFISLSLIFSFTCVFADNVVNTTQNIVNNAAGTVGNGINDVTGATKNVLTDTNQNVNTAADTWFKDEGNKIKNNLANVNNAVTGTYNTAISGTTGNYTAAKTSTSDLQPGTLLGMTSTAWTWLILGIAGIIIIGLVWYYSMQLTSNRYED